MPMRLLVQTFGLVLTLGNVVVAQAGPDAHSVVAVKSLSESRDHANPWIS